MRHNHLLLALLLAVSLLSSVALAQNTTRAVTQDGRDIALYPDGTWKVWSMDDVDVKNPAVAFSMKDVDLIITDSEISVNGEVLLKSGGKTGGHVIWFYSPGYGRFIFSTRQHPRYHFEQVEVIDNRRVVFNAGGKRFEWRVSAPLIEGGPLSYLWMMHDKLPDPLKDRAKTSGVMGTSTFYEPLLPNP